VQDTENVSRSNRGYGKNQSERFQEGIVARMAALTGYDGEHCRRIADSDRIDNGATPSLP